MPGTSEFAVSAGDSAAFARLSGDYNPLHIDPLTARRTPYGDTVVHGIHLLLLALEHTTDIWSLDGMEPGAVSFVFSSPVNTGATVRIKATADTSGSRIRFLCEAQLRTAFTATLELQPRSSALSGIELEDVESAPAEPQAGVFPPTRREGSVPLRLSRGRLSSLFPALAALPKPGWIADLLATTRIVGMECPGADSVYSTGKLRRNGCSMARTSMEYRIDKTDERFRMIRMVVAGAELDGHIEALFRPRPVAQRTLTEICGHVAPDCCRGQSALVIGGSRGLGELTAKIIASGGGDVTLTYSRGRGDAERVCEEIRRYGGRCTLEQLELGASNQLPAWLKRPFTHVYFFASPPISRNSAGCWNQTVFERMSDVYVRAFADVAHAVLAGRTGQAPATRFLYPSTIFLDEYISGFAEYCVAKAAGEALCSQLEHQYGIRIARPRLPRMHTDQTSGLRDTGMADSFAVMHAAVLSLGP